MKIRTRLMIGFLIIISIGFYYLITWLVHDVRLHYLKSMEETLVDTSVLLSSIVAHQVNQGNLVAENLHVSLDAAFKRSFSAKIYDLHKKYVNVRVYITDNEGLVLYDSDQGRAEGQDYSQWNDVYLTLQGRYGVRSSRTNEDDPNSSVLYVAAPILIQDKLVGVLSVGKPAESAGTFIELAKQNIIVTGIVACLGVIVLSIVMSLWITQPIQKLTSYAKAIRDGERVSLPQLGSNEMSAMAVAFEEMRDALEGKKYVEHYIQTLTHEIKSPLSAIRGAAELINEQIAEKTQKKFLRNIRTETDRIQNIIDRLLQLSAIETRKQLRNIEEITINSLITDVIESKTPLFTAKNISIVASNVEKITIRGEQFLLRQALDNLLQNALDFTPEQGTITVSTEIGATFLSVIIADSGPGVPDYALDKVFDRFYSLQRPDTGLKSSGLGLSFVQEIAHLHQGSISLENKAGGGVRATFKLSLF
ncbi:two-component system sensor histidine kinase CreC [candidate division CSSED10-310 bacterium]|uniref:histidine kinase n=1 Tax=candidate division CSSED10-310 bacterium TaxID=2855610 RepID=A0ABV6YYD1_UNCC1